MKALKRMTTAYKEIKKKEQKRIKLMTKIKITVYMNEIQTEKQRQINETKAGSLKTPVSDKPSHTSEERKREGSLPIMREMKSQFLYIIKIYKGNIIENVRPIS